jgi:dTDP-4-amino-4,6-dideoxygalactose transaminase
VILLNDFAREPAELVAAELAAMERVVRSGWYILGKEVEAFERSWAAYCGAGIALGVGNGMDAIEIGLRCRGIGPGDEVITTTMSAFASVLAVIRTGATPVLADIDPSTGLLDADSVRRCRTARTKGVLLVHLYGRCADMEAWSRLCADEGIALWEDCAQSHGARWRGRAAGTWGEFGAFSFYPTKNLGAKGDGGAVVAARAELITDAAMLRNYGQSERYHHPRLGLNSRLDEIQAAILSVRLGWLDRFTARRRTIAEALWAGLRNPQVAALAPPTAAEQHVHHLFVVRCARREALAAHLAARGVKSLIHYPIPIHHQQPCLGVVRDPRGLAAAELHARECLSLPCHPQMGDDEVAQVIEAVNGFA